MVIMADLEKLRNGMYVVCRAERKCPFTFESSPQLKCEFTSAGSLVNGHLSGFYSLVVFLVHI
jgi:hypothetical protein